MLCGAVVMFFILYITLIKPISDRRENSFQALQEEKARYERVITLAAKVANDTNQTKQSSNTNVPIRAAATEASKRIGIAIARIQPGRADSVSFWIDAAKTEELFNWLMLLDEEYGEKAKKISIQKNIDGNTLRGQFEFTGALQ